MKRFIFPAPPKTAWSGRRALKKEGGKPQPVAGAVFPPRPIQADPELLLFPGCDGLDRALFRAGAAVRTQFGIDGIFVFPLADRLRRTFILTGTTSNAFIGNDIRHFFLLLLLFLSCKPVHPVRSFKGL
jgi:hypothetical protein